MAIVMQAILSIWFYLDCALKKSLSIALAFLIACLPYQARAQEEGGDGGGAPAVVVIVVTCVAGVCIYKLARFCQKHFPNTQSTTNSPPDELTGSVDGSEVASWNIGNLGSCAGLDDHPSVTFAINGIVYPANVKRGPRIVSTVTVGSGKENYLTWSEFVAEAKSYGVVVSGVGDGSQYFARDGKHIDSSESIIHFDQNTMTVGVYSPGSKTHMVEVSRSTDLVNWERFMLMEVEENRNFQVVDTTATGQMFYGMRIVE
jgi:hypothetical protein